MSAVGANFEVKGNKTPRILLIDDDPFSYETVEAQLFQDGYELMFRNNGLDAVRQISTLEPDLILLDLMMPGISGFEVCQQIKNTPQLEHIPIILFSALDAAESVAAGFAAGADEFLTKPVRRAELRARIRSMLRIKHQYKELQQTLQWRENFSGTLLHDVRNPLAGIMLYTQLLQKRGELSQEQQQYLHLIHEEAQRLRLLLDQMQLLNKLYQGQQKLHRQLIDLRVLLRDIIPKYGSIVDAQSRTLIINIPSIPMPRLFIDCALIQHLVESLLSNAIRFTPTNAPVEIEIVAALSTAKVGRTTGSDEEETLQIIITDQGPPIPAQLLEDIYKQVEQWDVLVPERAGVGVSLALCKMIAEVHEGHLIMTSDAATGTRFFIDLPIPEYEWRPYRQMMQPTIQEGAH